MRRISKFPNFAAGLVFDNGLCCELLVSLFPALSERCVSELSYRQTSGPIDRTTGTPGSDKKVSQKVNQKMNPKMTKFRVPKSAPKKLKSEIAGLRHFLPEP